MALTGNIVGDLKVFYTEKEIEDSFFRISPVAKIVPKKRFYGKSYNFAVSAANGGSASGSNTVSISNAKANGTGAVPQFAVTNGQIFNNFFLTQQEQLATRDPSGAFVPAGVLKFAQALNGFRNLVALSLFSSGFGEFGQAGANAPNITSAGGSFTFDTADYSIVVNLSIGARFQFTNGATPASALRTSVNVVTAIDGTNVTFTSTSADGQIATTDWMCIQGCRATNASTTPFLPVGLTAWLPTIANRAGGTWTTYIQTSFFGVDRSVNTSGLAGQFVLQGGGEKRVDALVRGLQYVRTQAGIPEMIVLNPTQWRQIAVELQAQTTLMQQINLPSSMDAKNSNTRGITDMAFAFSTSFIGQVWDDPFCPTLTAYILEKDTLEFVALTNTDAPMSDGISENNPGEEKIPEAGSPGAAPEYRWLLDDWLTESPAEPFEGGEAIRINMACFGSWVINNPGHCGVVVFTS
jgi:hypothetical protein